MLRVTPDANGHATCVTSAFTSGGPETLTASYDDNITGDYGNSSSGAVAFDVQVPFRLTLASSANPALYGNTVTFTAVLSIGFGGCSPSANVTFYDGAIVLGSQPVQFAPANNYFSQFSTSSLTVGMHTITASYPGDPYCAPENASALTENVQGGSTISIAVTAGNIQFRQLVTFTATVMSAGGTPTGTVSFYDNGPLVATKSLDAGGSASVTEMGMAPGVHTIAVHYDGDVNFVAGDGLLTFYCSPKPH